MPKRISKKPKRSSDTNVRAFQIAGEATADPITPRREKNPAAVALGRLGGLKSGAKRMENLTQEQRSNIASRAAQKRWSKAKKQQQ